VDVNGRVPLAIATDPQRLRQILVNVVGNALKFTESGSVRITLSATKSAGRQWLHVDIADTGPGITPEGQRYLFEPFEQADDLTPRGPEGTGLGLSIARRLAEMLGGSLSLVHSAPDQGSTFRLTIEAPLVERSASGLAAGQDGASRPLAGVRALLAEDSADLQTAIKRLLQMLGASVQCANDGRDAIAQVMSGSFDVVLMDILMPNLNGLEAIRSLRSSGCDLPIVAFTGDATAALRLSSADTGCTVLLSKPFDAAHLLASIDAALKRRDEAIAGPGIDGVEAPVARRLQER
jgi:CheY-like chemotaxis protein